MRGLLLVVYLMRCAQVLEPDAAPRVPERVLRARSNLAPALWVWMVETAQLRAGGHQRPVGYVGCVGCSGRGADVTG